MKTAATIARYLLGLIFIVFGLNGFLQFIKQPPPANPLAMQFLTGVVGSHYAYMFFAFQLIAGLLLVSGMFVPLALVILAAELVNILTFHASMAPESAAPALLATVLWVLVFLQYRSSFEPLLRSRPVAG